MTNILSKKTNNKYIIIIVAVVAIVALLLFALPVFSYNQWKSANLQKANNAIGSINEASNLTNQFNDKSESNTAEDFDLLIESYSKANKDITEAEEGLESQFIGIDITGVNAKADDISNDMRAVYDEMSAFYVAEISGAEAEKELVVALGSIKEYDNSTSLKSGAKQIDNATAKYKAYLVQYGRSGLEKQVLVEYVELSEIFKKLADAYESNNSTALLTYAQKLDELNVRLENLDTNDYLLEYQNIVDQKTERLNKSIKLLE